MKDPNTECFEFCLAFKTDVYDQVEGKLDGRARNIVSVDDEVVQINQRFFSDEPSKIDIVLRRWKGVYYVERIMAIRRSTFEHIENIIDIYETKRSRR